MYLEDAENDRLSVWEGATGIPTRGIGKRIESHEFQGI